MLPLTLVLCHAIFHGWLSIHAATPVAHVPIASFNQLMERNVVPLTIAKIFSLNDTHDARVCILSNIFASHQDTPEQCTCSFARLRSIELKCANDVSTSDYDCSKKICETCCLLSLSSTFTKEFQHSDNPVNCKIRCLNSPIISDVTDDSQQFLSEFLRKVNTLYHAEAPALNRREEKEIPTQYHVVHLDDQREDTL